MTTYTDNFPYSDGNLVGNGNWIAFTGVSSPLVVSNQVNGIPATVIGSVYNAAFADAHFSRVKVFGATLGDGARQLGVAIRMQPADESCYFVLFKADGTCYTADIQAGAFTIWDNPVPGVTIADGDIIEMAVDATVNTTIHVKVNGAIVKTYTGVTALTGGKGGLLGYEWAPGVFMDDWEGGDVASANTLKTLVALADANLKTALGLPKASIKTLAGLTV